MVFGIRHPRRLVNSLQIPHWCGSQWAALLVLPLLLVGCARNDSAQATGVRAAVPVKVVKAARGDISSTLSYSGEVRPVDAVDIMPSASGRLDQVYVDEGTVVAAGTPLAQLETDLLGATIRQNRASVQSAQARLDAVLQGARPEEIAASRALLESIRNRMQGMLNGGRAEDIASATASLGSAQAKLTDLLAGPKSADLAAAQTAVATAQATLDTNQATLRSLLNPTQLDLAAAQAAVDAALAGVTSASAKLDDLKAGPKVADLAAAQAAVASAESTLRGAESTYAKLIQPLNDEKLKKLIEAYTNLNHARERLGSLRAQNAPEAQIKAAEDSVNLALRQLDLIEKEVNTFTIGITSEQVIATRATVDSAQAALDSARAKLKQLLDGATASDLQAAQAALDTARSNRDAAKTKLDKLRSPSADDITKAQASVDSAKATLSAAQAKLDQLRAGPTDAEIQTAKSGVTTAETALAKVRAPFTETDIGTQQALVAQAEQQTALAENKFTNSDILAATAAVAQAEATLQLSQINFDKATLLAPFDALVVKKNVSKGAMVNASTALFSLVSRDAQVVFNVEEASVGRLREALPATFTVTAFGDRVFRGAVTSISPTADSTSRTFRVKVTPVDNTGLRSGMFANITVTTEQQRQALTVPVEAVLQQGQESYVYVIKDDKAERRPIKAGLRDDQKVQVTGGLEEGDQIVTRGSRTLRPQDSVTIVP